MKTNITATIDNDLLQQKANEYAQKGAEETIKEFYSGYSSPYKKAIKEHLENRGFDHAFDLPDVVASINESLTKEIDKIANTAVAKTFVPMVTEFLTRAPKKMNFSEVLKEFINCSDFDHDEENEDDYCVNIIKEDRSFLRLVLENGTDEYEIGFYKEKDGYTIYSLPFTYSGEKERIMKISLDGGVNLELPFTKGVLENKFTSFIARLVMAETVITFDVKEFSEDMFPERDHCHC
ncbi:hypothetical protein MG296_10675 [Flavobacteriaceae bacterium TK19130]|nr:hypothetical protein [Thermobacterium salinum]